MVIGFLADYAHALDASGRRSDTLKASDGFSMFSLRTSRIRGEANKGREEPRRNEIREDENQGRERSKEKRTEEVVTATVH